METSIAIEKQTGILVEKQKEHVSERFLLSMDEYTKAELSDNAWLKQEVRIFTLPADYNYFAFQIATAKESKNKLASAVNSLENRNINAIEMVTNERTSDIENSRIIYLATNRKSPGDALKQAGDRSGLPSLVNIAQCTSDKVLKSLLCTACIHYKHFYSLGSWWSSWAIGNETVVSEGLQSTSDSTTRHFSSTSLRSATKFTEDDTI